MDNAKDAIMADVPATMVPEDISRLLQTPHSDAFAFTEQEQQILDLWDQLQDLELQQSFFEAQSHAQVPDLSGLSDDAVQAQLTKAETEATEARAEYLLRNKITQNIIMVDPVLKAVHGGPATGHAEKRLLPIIGERDVVSMVQNHLMSKLVTAKQALTAVEKDNILALDKNKDLAQDLFPFARELKAQSAADVGDPRLRAQVEQAEKEMKASRKTARLLKGVIAGMIVGSGVNWAEDELLRELVLDDEVD